MLCDSGELLIHSSYVGLTVEHYAYALSGDKNISILHSPCRTSDLQFSLVLQTHALVLKNWMGGIDVFEVPYITA